eukprot:g1214.t1
MVGLTVLVAVALLFMLNICLCIWKILHSEDNNTGQTGSNRNRNGLRRTNLNTRSIPVVFVNPGGSVRIGKKSKSAPDGSDPDGTESVPDTTDRYYYFDEVELDNSGRFAEPSRQCSVELPQTSRAAN